MPENLSISPTVTGTIKQSEFTDGDARGQLKKVTERHTVLSDGAGT